MIRVLDDFILLDKIGSGSFSKVYKVKDKRTGNIYAAKISTKAIDDKLSDLFISISNEVNIISKLYHLAILRFFKFCPYNFKKKPKPVIITEYAPNGTLAQLINEARNSTNSILDDTLKLIIICGISSAMQFLHNNNIIHRDLKPDNILLDKNWLPKIADFGFSKFNLHKTINDYINSGAGIVKGTPIYMAPEVWCKSEYSKSSDVYSFGILVYEIMTLKKLYDGIDVWSLGINVKNGERPDLNVDIPDAYKFLIQRCWDQKPENRPTFDQIFNELSTNKRYITKNVDEYQISEYITDLNLFRIRFLPNDVISVRDAIEKTKKKNEEDNYFFMDITVFKKNVHHCPIKYFKYLDEENRNFIKDAESGSDKKLFEVALNFIEGKHDFPFDVKVGLDYLKILMKKGNIDSIVYYIKMIIKGELIPQNLKKAKKMIDANLNKNDSICLFLLGKLCKKLKNYSDAQQYFQQSMDKGNADSIYEYIKLIQKGFCKSPKNSEIVKLYDKAIEKGCTKAMFKCGLNIKKSLKLIKMAADKGCIKAIYYYGTILGNKEESIEYFKRAAKEGHTESMNKYALMLLDNLYIYKKNDTQNKIQKEIVHYMKKAGDKGNIESIYIYGSFIVEGISGISPNPEKGIKYIKIAADQGFPDAIGYYGTLLKTGKGVDADIQKAENYYKLAISKGSSLAMNEYAKMLYESAVLLNIRSKDAIVSLFRMAIDKGNPKAMLNYAILLQTGQLVQVNLKKACKYYKMAIDYGCVQALVYYASMLENGNGVEVNYKEAIKYYKMAIDRGDTKAMVNYGNMLQRGLGCEINYKEAIKYYKMAIDCDDQEGMAYYAYMLHYGLGIEVNYKEAQKYYRMAVDKSSVKAMQNYANMIRQGHDIKISTIEYNHYLDIYNKTLNLELFNLILTIRYCQNVSQSMFTEYDKFFVRAPSSLLVTLAYFHHKGYFEGIDDIKAFYTLKNAIYKKDYPLAFTYYADANRQGLGTYVNYKKAIKYYKLAIDNDEPLAMTKYGEMLQNGIGVEKDYKEAIKYYKMAILRGEDKAMFNYGEMLQNGIGVEIDYEEAIKYYKMAIVRTNSKAMTNYGYMLQNGLGVEKNYKEAIEYYKKAIEQDDEKAMTYYGYMFQYGFGVEENYEEAIKLYKMAIAKGEYTAMTYYALFLRSGNKCEITHIEKMNCFYLTEKYKDPNIMFLYATLCHFDSYETNYEDALKYYKLAIEKGHSESISSYAYMLQHGQGVEINYQEAIKLYKTAIKKGDSFAFSNYAYMLQYGQGVEINYKEAIRLYKIAIDKNDSMAMLNYGDMIREGQGVEINFEEAQKYYRMAISKGNSLAMESYADLLHIGYGIKIEFNEAAKCYEKIYKDHNEDLNAIYLYATLNQYGLGVEQNYQQAVYFYYMAINKVHVKSMYHLATLIQKGIKFEGDFSISYKFQEKVFADDDPEASYLYATMQQYGVEYGIDFDTAIEYFKVAIKQGHAPSMTSYAYMLQNGQGVDINYKKAIKYYKRAIEKGEPRAMNNYAEMLQNGIGVDVDINEAKKLYKMAIKKGDFLAMTNYAYMLQNGIGVDANREEAIKLYKIAIEKGEDKAKILYKNMDV